MSKSIQQSVSDVPELYEPPLTTEGAAAFLNIAAHTLRNWRDRQVGPRYVAIRLGTRRTLFRYYPIDLRTFMEAHAVQASRMPKPTAGRMPKHPAKKTALQAENAL